MTAKQNVVQRKLVIIGPFGCGKTSLLRAVLHGHPLDPHSPFGHPLQPKLPASDSVVASQQYVPWEPTPGTYECNMPVGKAKDILVQLTLWDSASSIDCNNLECLKFRHVHIILICFPIDKFLYEDGDIERWGAEAACVCPGVPLILVGLQKDLRDADTPLSRGAERGANYVTKSEGEAAARRIGACKYFECSSLTGQGVREVFDGAATIALEVKIKDRTKTRCVML